MVKELLKLEVSGVKRSVELELKKMKSLKGAEASRWSEKWWRPRENWGLGFVFAQNSHYFIIGHLLFSHYSGRVVSQKAPRAKTKWAFRYRKFI